MSCSCGHDHHDHEHHFTKEEFEKAVQKFINDLPYQIDIDEEYQKIQNKNSKLSRSQRDTVVSIVEYKKEHFKD